MLQKQLSRLLKASRDPQTMQHQASSDIHTLGEHLSGSDKLDVIAYKHLHIPSWHRAYMHFRCAPPMASLSESRGTRPLRPSPRNTSCKPTL